MIYQDLRIFKVIFPSQKLVIELLQFPGRMFSIHFLGKENQLEGKTHGGFEPTYEGFSVSENMKIICDSFSMSTPSCAKHRAEDKGQCEILKSSYLDTLKSMYIESQLACR
jgi:hypothetical protein